MEYKSKVGGSNGVECKLRVGSSNGVEIQTEGRGIK